MHAHQADPCGAELDAMLAASGDKAAGPRAALYSPEFFEMESGEVVAYIPVDTGGSGTTEIPAAELVVAVHRGGFADLDQTFGALGVYIAEREIGISGPIREHHVVCAYDTADEARLVTEVGWPVFQTRPLSPAAGDGDAG